MRNIYITWHYTTHGVAYLKHILSAFYQKGIPEKKILFEGQQQEILNDIFDTQEAKNFKFDEVVYLTASQAAFDKLSSRRFSYSKTILEDEMIKNHGLEHIFQEIITNDDLRYNLEEEFSYVEERYPSKSDLFKKSVWRNIHHYSIEEQLKWLKEHSNIKDVYSDRIKVVELKVNDLRNEKMISEAVSKWAQEYFSKQKKNQPIINVSLGSNETQVVWHILAEAGRLPKNTRFIKAYDDKSDLESRFKRFSISEIPMNLISTIAEEFRVYDKPQSPSRELVNKKMNIFLKSGFSILLIGERGIGKSQIASQARANLSSLDKTFKGKLVEANCASFASDTMAESELFGYAKGAFTGAVADKEGLIKNAENGILFLDEIHHLSKTVQAKLMKALQTDGDNCLSIRRLGENAEKRIKDVRLIFATNKSVKALRKLLLADFYDRIVQHVISIPPLRETPEDRSSDWESTWEALKFKAAPPNEEELAKWLSRQPLYGNYRDLQKIAIYYNIFEQFDEETKNMLTDKTAFQYAKSEFQKYHSLNSHRDGRVTFEFSLEKNGNEIVAEFKEFLQEQAVKKFGSRKDAAEKLKVSEKTLNDWKNKKSLKH